MNNDHIGSSFDDFLEEEKILGEVSARAFMRVFAAAVDEKRKGMHMTKPELAKRMKTSRRVVDRMLDPTNHSATLLVLCRAADAVGLQINITLTRKETKENDGS